MPIHKVDILVDFDSEKFNDAFIEAKDSIEAANAALSRFAQAVADTYTFVFNDPRFMVAFKIVADIMLQTRRNLFALWIVSHHIPRRIALFIAQYCPARVIPDYEFLDKWAKDNNL